MSDKSVYESSQSKMGDFHTFSCVCGAHKIEVSRYRDDTDISITFWEYFPYQVGIFARYCKRLWSALRGKDYLLYDIILTEQDAANLAFILSAVKKEREE